MRSAAPVALLILAGCAPAIPDVVVIGPAAPDDFHAELHDAMASVDVASALDVAPEAMLPIASYLSAVHRRLHHAFAEGTLVEFERTRPPLERDLSTVASFALADTDGRLVDFRLLEASGVDTFDGAAITAMFRASPFGAPPREIVALDGRTHLAWRFRRKAADPCALRDASIDPDP